MPVVEQTVQLLAVQRLIGVGLKGNAAGAVRLPADLLREHGHGAFMHGRLLGFLSSQVNQSIHQSFGAGTDAPSAWGPIIRAAAISVHGTLVMFHITQVNMTWTVAQEIAAPCGGARRVRPRCMRVA